ncbi:amidophosphoribosyltransferase [Bacteroidota bacterium]
MSDQIKHECGIALIRLLKPLSYYQEKYSSWRYGLYKLYLSLEKQHNRGQDGAGVACVKLNQDSGKQFIFRVRSNKTEPLKDVFSCINKDFLSVEEKTPELLNDPEWVKLNIPFAGELYLGHLRYGTFGKYDIENVHPVLRKNNWRTRNLLLAGNFNLTNVDEIFNSLISFGQHPVDLSDTVTILENLGYYLDEENQALYEEFKNEKYSKEEISSLIADNLDVKNVLKSSSKKWDGGYVIAGIIGHGDSFVFRDPSGIRPAYYYYDEEIAMVTSERPAIQTTLNVPFSSIKELQRGCALIIKKDGQIKEERILKPLEKKSCSFERIYFSRGSDKDIYNERKKLGELLVPSIIQAVDNDFENTVLSYIPNTAESAFYGMVKGVETYLYESGKKKIFGLKKPLSEKELDKILSVRPRVEKIAIKDAKLRTFISQDKVRDDMVAHVYDITYGTIRKDKDNLVIIDDSIVRGTTLKKSIISILDRLGPKKIIVVSSSPQIRYPDCYGIDMAKLGDFIAFRAAIELLRDKGKENIILEVYEKCKKQILLPKEKSVNHVKEIYSFFTAEEISLKISQLLRADHINADVNIIYQSIESLHVACPDHTGDWYFTGNYPTPGGNKVVNLSYINYIEGKDQRAY